MSCTRSLAALKALRRAPLVVFASIVVALLGVVPYAPAQEPIKIGFSVSLTGGLASSGKAHLMSKHIWDGRGQRERWTVQRAGPCIQLGLVERSCVLKLYRSRTQLENRIATLGRSGSRSEIIADLDSS